MKTKENDKSESSKLRQKAEDELIIRNSTDFIAEADSLKLIHELHVHQIELEMQNEELIKAREIAESAMEKYTDLYDFAPSGYLTLSKEGDIVELNFLAAEILGKDRSQLKNTRFGLYISSYSIGLFNIFFDEIFRYKKKLACELSLQTKNDVPAYIHVEALVSQDLNSCLVNIIDITERKNLEKQLEHRSKQLNELNSYFMDRELRMVGLKEEINDLLIKSGCEKQYLI